MGYNILIVDDSATTRAMIKRTIQLARIETGKIYEAGDGRAGLEVLASNAVDVVLADLNMPEMGGMEMTHRMRQAEATRNVPVVVVSAEPNVERLEALKRDGIQGYVRKPFTPEGVRDAIAKALAALGPGAVKAA